MRVLGVGNVTSCNKAWIFLNDDGVQDRIVATENLLQEILHTANADFLFYGRMWLEISEEYEKRKVDVESRYHFISDEMVEEAYKRGRKEGFHLSLRKDSVNEECVRQYGRLHGFFSGASYALDKKEEAHRLAVQADNALRGK